MRALNKKSQALKSGWKAIQLVDICQGIEAKQQGNHGQNLRTKIHQIEIICMSINAIMAFCGSNFWGASRLRERAQGSRPPEGLVNYLKPCWVLLIVALVTEWPLCTCYLKTNQSTVFGLPRLWGARVFQKLILHLLIQNGTTCFFWQGREGKRLQMVLVQKGSNLRNFVCALIKLSQLPNFSLTISP